MVHHHFPVEHMPSGSIQMYTVHWHISTPKKCAEVVISNFPEATTSAPETRTPWYQEITFSFSARPYLLQTRDHKCTWMRPWRSHSYHPSFEFQIIPTCSWIFCGSCGSEALILHANMSNMECFSMQLVSAMGSFFIFSSNFGHMSAILEGPTCGWTASRAVWSWLDLNSAPWKRYPWRMASRKLRPPRNHQC